MDDQILLLKLIMRHWKRKGENLSTHLLQPSHGSLFSLVLGSSIGAVPSYTLLLMTGTVVGSHCYALHRQWAGCLGASWCALHGLQHGHKHKESWHGHKHKSWHRHKYKSHGRDTNTSHDMGTNISQCVRTRQRCTGLQQWQWCNAAQNRYQKLECDALPYLSTWESFPPRCHRQDYNTTLFGQPPYYWFHHWHTPECRNRSEVS